MMTNNPLPTTVRGEIADQFALLDIAIANLEEAVKMLTSSLAPILGEGNMVVAGQGVEEKAITSPFGQTIHHYVGEITTIKDSVKDIMVRNML
jgi:hypothetical protein